jgi:hypothetical protein
MMVVTALTAGGHLFGQTFQFGIKGGGNLSTFVSNSNPYYSSFSTEAGWNAGAFVNFMLGNHFSISPEVLYSTAGAKVNSVTFDNNNSNVSIDENLKLAYVSVPVMAKYRFTGGFFIETGPEVNFNVSSSQWQDQSVRNITNGAEFAWGLGVGYQSPFGLGIDLRYNQGISRVDNVSNAGWNDVSLRNSGFMLDLFWTFFNNKK